MSKKSSKIFKIFKESYWVTSKYINVSKEGKHIIDFKEDFPLIIKPIHFYIDYKLTPNYHDYLEIAYILEGRGTFLIGNKKYLAEEGDIFIINNVELHTILADHKKTLNLIAIYFLPELIYKPGVNEINLDFLCLFYKQGKNFEPRIPNDKVPKNIPNLIKKIHLENINNKQYYKITTKTLLQDIIIELLYYYKDNITYSRTIYDQSFKNINKLRDVFLLITNNFDQNITLEQAAKTVYMSTHYFCKIFKKVTGTTFKEYLNKLRIDKAKELILRDNISITDIAFQVGFEHLSYFYRVFKKLTKLNPNEFRSIFKDR